MQTILILIHVVTCTVVVVFIHLLEGSPSYAPLIRDHPFMGLTVRWIVLFIMGIPVMVFYRNLRKEKQERRGEASGYKLDILAALDELLKEKQPSLEYHCKRVAAFAGFLCDALKVPAEERKQIMFAAMFHDIGKVFVETEHLQSHARYRDAEREHKQDYEQHPILAGKVLEHIKAYPQAGLIVRHYHERWDGKGFPEELSGTMIPLGSRIIGIANFFDVLEHGLDGDPPMGREEALKELKLRAGSHFDPDIVPVFEKIIALQKPG